MQDGMMNSMLGPGKSVDSARVKREYRSMLFTFISVLVAERRKSHAEGKICARFLFFIKISSSFPKTYTPHPIIASVYRLNISTQKIHAIQNIIST